MTVIIDIFKKLKDCYTPLPSKFTTDSVIEIFKEKYPVDWMELLRKYGDGGKGNGREYTSSVYIGQMLWVMSKKGMLRHGPKDFQRADKNWGNLVIAKWSK